MNELTSKDQTAQGMISSQKTQIMQMQTLSADTFSYGSSFTRVAKIHGPPDRTEGNDWYYGESRVTFSDGTVVDWESHPSNPLSTRDDSI